MSLLELYTDYLIWLLLDWKQSLNLFELPLLLRKILLSPTVSFEESHKKIFLNRRQSDDVKFYPIFQTWNELQLK